MWNPNAQDGALTLAAAAAAGNVEAVRRLLAMNIDASADIATNARWNRSAGQGSALTAAAESGSFEVNP